MSFDLWRGRSVLKDVWINPNRVLIKKGRLLRITAASHRRDLSSQTESRDAKKRVHGQSATARKHAPQAIAVDSSVDQSTKCPRGFNWEVHKFGGTCLATAERIRAAAKLVVESPIQNKVMVVSGMGSHGTSPVKVTDLLLRMIEKAAKQDVGFMMDLAALQEKHVNTARALLSDPQELNQFLGTLMDDVANLKAMLQAISIGMDVYVRMVVVIVVVKFVQCSTNATGLLFAAWAL